MSPACCRTRSCSSRSGEVLVTTTPFCSYVNTTSDIIVNDQVIGIFKALMWLAGFEEKECARGVTKWSPIATGGQATSEVRRASLGRQVWL